MSVSKELLALLTKNVKTDSQRIQEALQTLGISGENAEVKINKPEGEDYTKAQIKKGKADNTLVKCRTCKKYVNAGELVDYKAPSGNIMQKGKCPVCGAVLSKMKPLRLLTPNEKLEYYNRRIGGISQEKTETKA